MVIERSIKTNHIDASGIFDFDAVRITGQTDNKTRDQLKVQCNTLTTGIGVNISSTSLTTGDALRINLTESVLNGGNYINCYDQTSESSVFKVAENGVGTLAGLTLTGDMTIFDASNNADTSLSIGTSATEALVIEVLNGAANQTAEEVKFTSKTASVTGDHGKFTFSVDESDTLEINDAGINVTGTITGDTSLTLDAQTITTAQIAFLDVTEGAATASKALVLDSSKDIATIRNLTIDGTFSDGNYTFTTDGNVSGLGTVGCGAITTLGNLAVTGTITGDTSLTLDAVTITTAEIGVLDGITNGTAAVSKAVVLDSSGNITSIGTVGCGAITSTGDMTIFDADNNADTSLSIGTSATEALVIEVLNGAANQTAEEVKFTSKTASVTGDHGKFTFSVDESDTLEINDAGINVTGTITGDTSLTLDAVTISTAEITVLDSVTAGTAAASKALVLDSNLDIGTIRNLTIDGTFSDGNYTFDTSGNVSALGTIGCGAITSTEVMNISKDTDAEFVALVLVNESDAADTTGIVSMRFDLEDTSGNTVDSGKIAVKKNESFTSTGTTQDSNMIFSTSLNGTLTEQMTLTSAGTVMIGTDTPVANTLLHVNTSTTSDVIRCGVAAMGLRSTNNLYAFFGHADTNDTTDYAISCGSAGDLFLNASNSAQIAFNIEGSTVGRFHSTGDFGLGMVPTVELQISGATAYKSSGTTWGNPSDQRLKNNIIDYSKIDALDKINRLKLRKYRWNSDYLDFHKMEDREYVGFIGQEVEPIMPCCIKTHSRDKTNEDAKAEAKLEDLKVLDVDEINKIAIGAIQELSEKLNNALARIVALENK